MVVNSSTQSGWVQSLLVDPKTSGPNICSQCCPLNDRRNAAHTHSPKNQSSPFSSSLLSSLSISDERKHSSECWFYLPCSVCIGNMIRRGRTVQWCTCSTWVHLQRTFPYSSGFNTLSSYGLELFTLLHLRYSWEPQSTNAASSLSLEPCSRGISTCRTHPSTLLSTQLSLLHSCQRIFLFCHVTNPSFSLFSTFLLLDLLPRPLLFLPLLTHSGFSNGMHEVLVPKVLHCFTLFCSFPSIVSVSRIQPQLFIFPRFLDTLSSAI